jgi:ribosome-associated protein
MENVISLLINELSFKTSRSGGAGGQNVNKVSTKVELLFHINESEHLSEEQKVLLLEKLANRISKSGNLQLVSQSERTQLKNKRKVIQKFRELVSESFQVKVKRLPTKIPKSVIEKRLSSKKRLSEIKKSRTFGR